MIAKVALKAASGIDLDVTGYLNAIKSEIGEQLADEVDMDNLQRFVLGEDAGPHTKTIKDTERLTKASYEALSEFMRKEEVDRESHVPGTYVDFRDEMTQLDDGKGDLVWVRNVNAPLWLRALPAAPSR